jgi:hypothetical protein
MARLDDPAIIQRTDVPRQMAGSGVQFGDMVTMTK